METRINKYLSEIGYCSRREADRLIEDKRITVNDIIPEIGTKISENDVVKVDGKVVSRTDEIVYIALHKPVGITSTTDQSIKGNIVDFMKYPSRIFHVGRLDKDSSGLILMTNDGDIVNKILRAENNHEKEYIVRVDKPISNEFIEGMKSGVPILNTTTKPCTIQRIGHKEFSIVLTEGMNRQIRRMCHYFGFEVHNLQRVRIMNIKLDIPKGEWRHLTEDEVLTLKNLVENSSKTHD